MALGEIVKNMEALVIDEEERPVSIGGKGQLCVSGKQLSGGYLKDPAKNKESFFTRKNGDREKGIIKPAILSLWMMKGVFFMLDELIPR